MERGASGDWAIRSGTYVERRGPRVTPTRDGRFPLRGGAARRAARENGSAANAAVKMSSEADESYAALLAHGHWSAYTDRGSSWDAQEAWLELALRWWKELADRARQDGLPILCFRGWDEYSFSAAASLLHPHTSAQINASPEPERLANGDNFDLLSVEFAESVAAVNLWRRVAHTPPPAHPELDEQIEVAYAKLVRDGHVKGPSRTERLIPWQEALNVRARRDELPLYCDRHPARAYVLDPEVRMPLPWLRELRAEVEV